MPIFKNGILGINARNLLYIAPYNKEKGIEIADDKIKSKAFLSARGIPVPKLLGIVSNRQELQKFNFNKLGSEFVLKPNLGYGGQGIIPIVQKSGLDFLDGKGIIYTRAMLADHIREILAGQYSLNEKPARAFFEKLIISDDILGRFSFGGLPDIRIILHNLVPVMAMLRLPSMESSGKANLHLGAYGAGIDLAKGVVTHLTHHEKIIKEIPGLGPIRGLKIPFWNDILYIACQSQLASNLGYMGADIALDKHQGPVLLEINARAGLGIQIANMSPLRKRLEKIEGIEVKTIEKGIRMAKDMFGYTIEKNIKSLSGKNVIGIHENIQFLRQKAQFPAVALINISRKKNYLGLDLAKTMGLIQSKKSKDLEDLRFKLKYKLGNRQVVSIFRLDRKIKKKHQVVLGNRDISGSFLIDPSINNLITEKQSGETKRIFITDYDPLDSDRKICKIITQLKFLSYFRPLNFLQESQRFSQEKNYNPKLLYKEYDNELPALRKELHKIKYDDSDLGRLFHNKIKELDLYFELIQARGSDDFTEISTRIFGAPSVSDIEEIRNKPRPPKIKGKKTKITSSEVQAVFEKALEEYGLKEWRVIQKKNLLSKCVVNRNKRIIIRKNSLFNRSRLEDLIIHEIDTHLLTGENGGRQKYKLFNHGFANYLETQEGLAMYNVINQSSLHSDEHYKDILTEAIFEAGQMSLLDLYHYLKTTKKMTESSAIDICFRVKRGFLDTAQKGAFTKDYCYFSGRKKIQRFVNEGGDLADLYFGKYSLDDIDLIRNISVFQKPPILPKWLQ